MLALNGRFIITGQEYMRRAYGVKSCPINQFQHKDRDERKLMDLLIILKKR
jgi:hypothetical protein